MFHPLRRAFTASLVLTAFTLAACQNAEKQKEEQAGTAAEAAARPAMVAPGVPGASSLQNRDGLFAFMPADTKGFFFWDLSSPAVDRLMTSHWGKTYLSQAQSITTTAPQFSSLLKEAGLPVENPEELRKTVREALVVFTKSTTSQPTGGLILRTTDAAKAASTFAALRAAAQKRNSLLGEEGGKMVIQLEIPNTSAAAPADPGAPVETQKVKLITTTKDDRIIFSDKRDTLTKLSTGGEKAFPGGELESISQENSNPSDRLGMGFVDIAAIAREESPEKPSPVSSAFLAAQMTDRPILTVKVKKTHGAAKGAAVAGPAKVLLATLPAEPLLFVTLQAGTIRDLVAQNSAEAAAMMNDTQFAPLKALGSISIAAKIPQEAQAMLPIPEVIIGAETSNPAELSSAIVDSATGAMAGYGMPATVTQSTIAGTPVKVIPGAMGLSLYVAETPGGLITSTSEPLMTAALTKLKTGEDPLAGMNLPSAAVKSITAQGFGRIYLSFPELAKFLESAKGFASMSPNPASDMLSAENLKVISELGVLLTSFSDEGDVYKGEISHL